MFVQGGFFPISGLSLGVLLAALNAGDLYASDSAASLAATEVAVAFKTNDVTQFRLADYRDELIDCSALAATHTLISDNIGEDAGAEVRRALASDYWIETSKAYMSLAQEASGQEDLYGEMGIRMRALAADWRQLTESGAGPDRWAGWYELVDRCDTWRAEPPIRSYYTRGRPQQNELESGTDMAVATP